MVLVEMAGVQPNSQASANLTKGRIFLTLTSAKKGKGLVNCAHTSLCSTALYSAVNCITAFCHMTYHTADLSTFAAHRCNQLYNVVVLVFNLCEVLHTSVHVPVHTYIHQYVHTSVHVLVSSYTVPNSICTHYCGFEVLSHCTLQRQLNWLYLIQFARVAITMLKAATKSQFTFRTRGSENISDMQWQIQEG